MEQQLGSTQYPLGAVPKTLGSFQTRRAAFEQLLAGTQEQPSPSRAPAIVSDEHPGAGMNRGSCSEQAEGEPQERGRRPKKPGGIAEPIPS